MIVGSGTWLLMIPKYTAYSMLQVATRERKLVFDTVDQTLRSDFDVYKATQKELIKSPFVLTTALRKSNARRVRRVQEEIDPIAWLGDELVVRFPEESEIMIVSLTGDDADEVATLVRAVVNRRLEAPVRKTLVLAISAASSAVWRKPPQECRAAD